MYITFEENNLSIQANNLRFGTETFFPIKTFFSKLTKKKRGVDISGSREFFLNSSRFYSRHITHNTYAGSYLLTHVHFTCSPIHFICPLLFIAVEILRIVFQNTATNHRHPAPPPPASQTSHQPSCYFPVHRHLHPRLPLLSGTYSIDRSARPCHGLSTVDPRYLVGFRGSYADTLGMFVEEAGAAEQQQ